MGGICSNYCSNPTEPSDLFTVENSQRLNYNATFQHFEHYKANQDKIVII